MGCLCNDLASKDASLASTCIGHLWMFEHLQPSELEALVTAAERRQFKKGQAVFMQGNPGTEMFLIKAGRVASLLWTFAKLVTFLANRSLTRSSTTP